MWQAIGISLTCTLEESTKHGVGTRDMRYPEMIQAVELRVDLNPWIEVCCGTLDAEDTWRAIHILLTGKSKKGGALSYEITKCEITT